MPEVAERCLNHIEENKVKHTDQRHSYQGEMQAAWAVLGEYLTAIITPNSAKDAKINV